MAEFTEVKQAKEAHKESILSLPNLVGVGVGYKAIRQERTDELCIVALVRQKVPLAALAPEARLPPRLDDLTTDVVEAGDVRPLLARTDRWRPAPGGVSLGHYQITAGTFGAVVRDRASGDRLILSNNHVLANSNDAKPGDPILQPGPVDGGRLKDSVIAQLERFCPIQFGVSPPSCSLATGVAAVANSVARLLDSRHRLYALRQEPNATNLVDAAVARLLDEDTLEDQILGIGAVSGAEPAALAMAVRKSGRTTEFTTGEITVLEATVIVNYGPNQSARFEDQIVTSPMSQGGDSGSLLVAGDSQQAVGLLFAGSELTTIHSPIQAVLDCLDVVL